MIKHRLLIQRFRIKLTFFLAVVFLLTACSGYGRPALGTATPRPPTATPILPPTVVWFPSTETPASEGSTFATATPDLQPGIGEISFTDDFTEPENWSELGGLDYIRDGQLTLAASAGTHLMSLHQQINISDFHAEITVRIHLCRGADEYGLLLRAIPAMYYRFALNCNGEARVDRVRPGERIMLQPPHSTSDAPHGGPADIKMGVWVAGREMRFFINNHYQFTVTDGSFQTGTLGVFVRASEDSPITISFSDLIVRDVNYTPPVPEP